MKPQLRRGEAEEECRPVGAVKSKSPEMFQIQGNCLVKPTITTRDQHTHC